MQLPIQKISSHVNPFYSTDGAAGIDLQTTHRTIVKLGKISVVETGLAVAIPEGYVGQIWPRSGLSIKRGIHRTAGIIDSDFRGELKIGLTGLDAHHQEIEPYEYVAQLLIVPVVQCELMEVDELPDTERGETGFGQNNPEKE